MSLVSGQVSVGVGMCKSSPEFAKISQILPKSAGFCWIWLDLEETLVDGSWRDLDRSQRDQARSQRDQARSQKISKRLGQISRRSRWILTDWTTLDRRTLELMENNKFWCIRRSGRLKIGFSCLNPSTDPPVLGFGGGDLPSTIASIGLNGSRAGSARLGGLIGFRVWLDTPRWNPTVYWYILNNYLLVLMLILLCFWLIYSSRKVFSSV